MYDLMQQLAEPEREILEIIGADVLPVLIDEPKEWKESTLPDGSPSEVPIFFNPGKEPDGSWVLRDDEGRIVSRMSPGGYCFDSVYHPLADLRSVEELKGLDFFSPLSRERLDDLRRRIKELHETTDYALMLNGAGGIYEWAQGLRGWDQFMVDLISDPEFAGALLDKLLEANIRRPEPAGR